MATPSPRQSPFPAILTSRRAFLRTSVLASLGLMTPPARLWASTDTATARVALTHGQDPADNVFRALLGIREDIVRASRGKRILIKPNCVIHIEDAWRYQGVPANLRLSDTPAAHLEGILEFFMHIGRRDLLIAESCATGPTFEAFDNLGYFDLAKQYPVQFQDINQEPFRVEEIHVGDQRVPCRFFSAFWDNDTFVVSAPKLKTHNNAVATLSLKNVVMGAPMNLPHSGQSHKGIMHGRSNQDLHDNMFRIASRGVRPHLAVMDGYEGMQGNGPNHGTPVPQGLAIASTDFLAADRVALELMGIADSIQALGHERQFPAYLEYCAQAGLGTWDLSRISLIGIENLLPLRFNYQLHDLIETQINLHPLPPHLRPHAVNAASPHCPPLNGAWLSDPS